MVRYVASNVVLCLGLRSSPTVPLHLLCWFAAEVLAARLAAVGAIFEEAAAPGAPRQQAADTQQRTMRQGGRKRADSDEDSDFD